MLIAGILILIVSVMNYMLANILGLLIRIFGNTPHAFLLGLLVIDILFYIFYILFFSFILSVTLVGGIIGILDDTTYIILLSYYYYMYSSHIFQNEIVSHLSLIMTVSNLIASIIVFIKILNINKIASAIGFVGVIFRLIDGFLIYSPLLHTTNVLIINASEYLEIIGDMFYGIGLIFGMNILGSVFFRNTGEAKIELNFQTQGNIKAIILNGTQAISYIPSYVRNRFDRSQIS